jgi:hypothetical protein
MPKAAVFKAAGKHTDSSSSLVQTLEKPGRSYYPYARDLDR